MYTQRQRNIRRCRLHSCYPSQHAVPKPRISAVTLTIPATRHRSVFTHAEVTATNLTAARLLWEAKSREGHVPISSPALEAVQLKPFPAEELQLTV